MRISHFAALVILFASTLGYGQVDDRQERIEAQSRAIAKESELMHQCEESRKAGRLKQAEAQCLAAIQIAQESGWPARGYRATLGMIYYEQGEKRLGFVTLRDSWDGYHGSEEAELYLGRMAIELRETKVAQEVVDRFRRGEGNVGPMPTTTKPYWPKGNDAKSLQATIEFLEGDRLCQSKATTKKGIELLRHADKLCSGNVAICYSLAWVLKDDGLAAEPYFRVVSQKGAAGIQWDADDWLGKHEPEIRKAQEGKTR
jgi:hypothetical protein